MTRLGVNIDHVASVRQARRTDYPDPLEAARLAERGGAKAITVHLREDRRHIQDYDVLNLRGVLRVHLNLELAPLDEMVELAARVRPNEVCLVPERRAELTTEGGLDVAGLTARLTPLVRRLHDAGVVVSLFVDPEQHQLAAAAALGAEFVELHTGTYANQADADLSSVKHPRVAKLGESSLAELEKVRTAAEVARVLKLKCNAGHGLNYRNVGPIAALGGLQWLHIGHAIVARAVMVGMVRAVREMKALLDRPDRSLLPRAGAGRSSPARRRSRR
jgi:pyridoxine 5-phosphate synthase